MLILIAALDQNRIIAEDGRIPWRIPSDLRHFQRTTWGHPVVMGRKTFESIGRPLPDRHNIVLSRSGNRVFDPNGYPCVLNDVIAGSMHEVLALSTKLSGGDEVYVIGGAEVYAQTINLADKLVITHVARLADNSSAGRAYFPEIKTRVWKPSVLVATHQSRGDEYPTLVVEYTRAGR